MNGLYKRNDNVSIDDNPTGCQENLYATSLKYGIFKFNLYYKLKVSRFLKMWQELKNSTSKAVKSPFILYPAFALFSVKKYILIKWLWDDYLMYMYCIGSLFLFRIPLYITRDYIHSVYWVHVAGECTGTTSVCLTTSVM